MAIITTSNNGTRPRSKATSRGSFAKAQIKILSDNSVIPCRFNPTEYSISKSVNWNGSAVPGSNVPTLTFGGGDSKTLSLELFLDSYENSDGGTVKEHVKKLFKLVTGTKKKGGKGLEAPPTCRFEWGQQIFFEAVVTQLDVTYTLFHQDGNPARAKVKLNLREFADGGKLGPQNPTSRGEPGHKVHVVKPDETLSAIAAREYGRPGEWRWLADINDLDDPKDLHPGQILSIAPLGE